MGFNQPIAFLTPTQVAQVIAAVPTPAQNAAAVVPSIPTPTQIVGAASAGAVPSAAVVATTVNTNVKTRHVVTLLSGSSWTPPAGCLYVNAKLIGGGEKRDYGNGVPSGGQVVETTVTTTPGVPISYAIGAGGAGTGSPFGGGNTTFTGATTALGGSGSMQGETAANGNNNTTAGAGSIILEFWI